MRVSAPLSGLGLGLLFLVAGCSGNQSGGNQPPPDNGPEVTFMAADGLVVHATVGGATGGGKPVAVLAHQLCSNRAEWSATTHDWVSAFAQRGVTTLAIDLRGHGRSTLFPDGSIKDLCSGGGNSALYAGMVSDVKAAVDYARGTLNAKSVAVLGASIGSNSALVAFADDAQLAMVVALSPGLDYAGIQTSDAVTRIGSRPALLEAADDDSYSATSVRQLKQQNGAVSTQVWPTGGHANQIFVTHPEELTRVADLVVSKLGL